ncbi:response regulator [Paenibacillus filicis]|uniref:Response regulator n=1 Tax=Paenibacillus filicis TaxID=669464 RepID=A0ABU9DP93_9BACL
MRAILVDDERLALMQLRHMLEKMIGGVEVVGMYTNPSEVLESARELQPDVVFLDIHMPEINGLQLGSSLQQALPRTEIVFVTGYDQYAVNAFELYALDYVMKPIQQDRLHQTVKRLQHMLEKQENMEAGPVFVDMPPRVCCFNRISFQRPGQSPEPVKWRTSKAQELFAYMLHHREQFLARDTLAELLWPDFDGPRAAQQLYTTIYHIRQTLKNMGLEAVTIAGSGMEIGYTLSMGKARLDCEEWEEGVKALQALTEQNVQEHERMLGLYKGDYLGQLDYLWAENERERLRRIWLQQAERLSDFYAGQNSTEEAIRLYQRMQQLFPYEESGYFSLMKLFESQGNWNAVKELYALLLSKVGNDLESPISESITDWYNERSRQKA